jgi:hypothetical protein
MPTYTFKDTKSGEVFEKFMSMSALDTYMEENPHIIRHHEGAGPAFAYNLKSLDQRTSNGWKEVLSKISEKHPASPLAEKYGPRKSIAEVKTQEIRQKHKKKREKQQ